MFKETSSKNRHTQFSNFNLIQVKTTVRVLHICAKKDFCIQKNRLQILNASPLSNFPSYPPAVIFSGHQNYHKVSKLMI